MTNEHAFELVKGDVVWADLGDRGGSLQKGIRPVVVINNRSALRFSTVITVIPATSNIKKLNKIPTHVLLDSVSGRKCVLLPEQLVTVNRTDLIGEPIYRLNPDEWKRLHKAVDRQLGFR